MSNESHASAFGLQTAIVGLWVGLCSVNLIVSSYTYVFEFSDDDLFGYTVITLLTVIASLAFLWTRSVHLPRRRAASGRILSVSGTLMLAIWLLYVMISLISPQTPLRLAIASDALPAIIKMIVLGVVCASIVLLGRLIGRSNAKSPQVEPNRAQ